MAEHQPDEHYAEFLNITLKQEFDEWKLHVIDIDNIQSNVLKTYLWINALVATAIISLLAYVDLRFATMNAATAIYGAGLAGAALWAIASFITAIRMLVGTTAKATTEFYLQKINVAYYDGTVNAKQDWIAEMDRIITDLRGYNNEIAQNIHALNQHTCSAAILGAASAAILFISNLVTLP